VQEEQRRAVVSPSVPAMQLLARAEALQAIDTARKRSVHRGSVTERRRPIENRSRSLAPEQRLDALVARHARRLCRCRDTGLRLSRGSEAAALPARAVAVRANILPKRGRGGPEMLLGRSERSDDVREVFDGGRIDPTAR
jgi:hypothetical protein